ncbi:MAG TPA: hypothetical protein VMW58_14460 [Anaerolineae bacterium]|nr:hypothetical protein [Anaerolineae bacterium]
MRPNTYEYGDTLVSRINKKPPVFSLERVNDDGTIAKAALIKLPKGMRGWVLRLGKTSEKLFKTRRRAVDFFDRLRVMEEDKRRPPTTKPTAPFSHNDVDEDGAIIDVDVEGNRMEYGK